LGANDSNPQSAPINITTRDAMASVSPFFSSAALARETHAGKQMSQRDGATFEREFIAPIAQPSS